MACYRFAMKRLISSTATITRRSSSSAVVVPPFRHPSLTTNYYNNFNFNKTNATRGFFSDNRFLFPLEKEDENPDTSLDGTLMNLNRKRDKRDNLYHDILDNSVNVFLVLICYHNPDMIKYAIGLALLKCIITLAINKSRRTFGNDLRKVLCAHHHGTLNLPEAPDFKCFHKFEITKDDGFHVYLKLNGYGNQYPEIHICNHKLVVICNLRYPSGKQIMKFMDLPKHIFDQYDPYKFTSHVLEGGELKFSFPNAKEPVVKPDNINLQLK